MEGVRLPVRLVRDSRVVVEATDDLHLARLEGRLHSEGTPCPPLASKTVAEGDDERIALDLKTKLPAVTRGLSSGHRRET
jgi:hypothetical protein